MRATIGSSAERAGLAGDARPRVASVVPGVVVPKRPGPGDVPSQSQRILVVDPLIAERIERPPSGGTPADSPR